MTTRPSAEELLALARDAATRAYARYSGYAVGAALVTDHGEVFTGCNVENAAYGLTMCAERGAVSAMVAAGAHKIVVVAVVGGSAPCFPCGACRQVLAEFGCDELVVDDGVAARSYPFEEVLPHAFGPESLP